MSVPVRLLAVNGQMDADAVLPAPRIKDLLIIDQILLGTSAAMLVTGILSGCGGGGSN